MQSLPVSSVALCGTSWPLETSASLLHELLISSLPNACVCSSWIPNRPFRQQYLQQSYCNSHWPLNDLWPLLPHILIQSLPHTCVYSSWIPNKPFQLQHLHPSSSSVWESVQCCPFVKRSEGHHLERKRSKGHEVAQRPHVNLIIIHTATTLRLTILKSIIFHNCQF